MAFYGRSDHRVIQPVVDRHVGDSHRQPSAGLENRGVTRRRCSIEHDDAIDIHALGGEAGEEALSDFIVAHHRDDRDRNPELGQGAGDIARHSSRGACHRSGV